MGQKGSKPRRSERKTQGKSMTWPIKRKPEPGSALSYRATDIERRAPSHENEDSGPVRLQLRDSVGHAQGELSGHESGRAAISAREEIQKNSRWYTEDLSQTTVSKRRLLMLEPGKHEDPISGRLEYFQDSEMPRYDCLSYSWGEQMEWEHITVDNVQRFTVTKTLANALRRMRTSGAVRILWIDAICIDQANIAERNSEVRKMDKIFSEARNVIVWLGEGNNTTSSLNSDESQYNDAQLAKLAMKGLATEHAAKHDEQAWWNRMWVIQEVALAESLSVYYGSYIIPWSEFITAAETGEQWQQLSKIMQLRFISRVAKESTLLRLLELTGGNSASDPRDLVFALVGLASDFGTVEECGLGPDYNLSLLQVLERLWAYLKPHCWGDNNGSTTCLLVCWAIECGHSQLTRTLLSLVDFQVASFEWHSNLWDADVLPMLAARSRHTHLVRILLDTERFDINASYPVDEQDKDNGYAETETLLIRAAKLGDEEMVQMLVDTFGADAGLDDDSGSTPLWWATNFHHVGAVKLLLKTGRGESNKGGEDGSTPLLLAARTGDVKIAKLLLDTGYAGTNVKDSEGETPLIAAATNHRSEIVKLLRDTRLANPNIADNDGTTPLHASLRDFETTELLLSFGEIDINGEDRNGETPLSLAADLATFDTLCLLLNAFRTAVKTKHAYKYIPPPWLNDSELSTTLKSFLMRKRTMRQPEDLERQQYPPGDDVGRVAKRLIEACARKRADEQRSTAPDVEARLLEYGIELP